MNKFILLFLLLALIIGGVFYFNSKKDLVVEPELLTDIVQPSESDQAQIPDSITAENKEYTLSDIKLPNWLKENDTEAHYRIVSSLQPVSSFKFSARYSSDPDSDGYYIIYLFDNDKKLISKNPNTGEVIDTTNPETRPYSNISLYEVGVLCQGCGSYIFVVMPNNMVFVITIPDVDPNPLKDSLFKLTY